MKSSQCTVTNKSVVESTIRKHREKENREPSTSAYNNETVKPSDNLSGNIMYYIIFLFLLKNICYIFVYSFLIHIFFNVHNDQ